MVKKNRKKTLTQKLGQNFKIEKISPLEKNSKIMCAKYQDSNFKTVLLSTFSILVDLNQVLIHYFIKRLSTLTLVTFHPHQGWKVTFSVFF